MFALRALLLLVAAQLQQGCGDDRDRATAPRVAPGDRSPAPPIPHDAAATLDALAVNDATFAVEPLDGAQAVDAHVFDSDPGPEDAISGPRDGAPGQTDASAVDADPPDASATDAAPDTCGDGVCQLAETCHDCPGDCPVCCGDGQCLLRDAESCVRCEVDCACGSGQYCDLPLDRCVVVCIPQCSGRVCGPDLCGGRCGECVPGQACEGGRCR
ncbi:MAG: hypothetical protein H6704_11090 [Myxococcales bacterium]|nr:hypothetical protein [Myxococcales bacterium]